MENPCTEIVCFSSNVQTCKNTIFFFPFPQKKNYDRVMKALDSITSIREMTQVRISAVGLGSSALLE